MSSTSRHVATFEACYKFETSLSFQSAPIGLDPRHHSGAGSHMGLLCLCLCHEYLR